MLSLLKNIIKKPKYKPRGYKIVYQLNDIGVYLGETIADECAVESGVYHIPRNCIELAPPTDIEGKYRIYRNNVWEYEDIPSSPDTVEFDPAEEEIDRILTEIKDLETWIQPSLVREVVLNVPGSLEKLKKLDETINDLKSKLPF